jgi:hypothetical protein
MSDGKKQGDENWRDATPEDVFKVLRGETVRARVREELNENWVSTDVDGYDLHITGWHRDKFIDSEGSHWSLCQVPVEEIGKNVGDEVIEAFSPVTVETKPKPKQHRTPTLADLAGGAITCEVRQGSGDNWEKKLLIHIFKEYDFPFVTASQGSIHRWAYCRIEVPVVPCKSDRPLPKGFRLLGDEPRLSSDGYWSLSCKDWLVIGDRVEAANRDKWPAIRFVVDEPEPVKQQFVLGLDPASVFGSDPVEVRPIMQIRLPVPASVLGKLGDMLEKHYPGSTMRQVGGYLVFEEPIES